MSAIRFYDLTHLDKRSSLKPPRSTKLGNISEYVRPATKLSNSWEFPRLAYITGVAKWYPSSEFVILNPDNDASLAFSEVRGGKIP